MFPDVWRALCSGLADIHPVQQQHSLIFSKAVRYPKFLAESIHESIRQKSRDTRVDTRYSGGGGGRGKAVKMWKKANSNLQKRLIFFLLNEKNYHADAMLGISVHVLHYPTNNVRARFCPDIGRVLYPIRYSSCRVDTRLLYRDTRVEYRTALIFRQFSKSSNPTKSFLYYTFLSSYILQYYFILSSLPTYYSTVLLYTFLSSYVGTYYSTTHVQLLNCLHVFCICQICPQLPQSNWVFFRHSNPDPADNQKILVNQQKRVVFSRLMLTSCYANCILWQRYDENCPIANCPNLVFQVERKTVRKKTVLLLHIY